MRGQMIQIEDYINKLANSNELVGEDLEIAKLIIGRGGRLRSSKPQLKDDLHREASYVWRMVAFHLSNRHEHHCMPVMADFDLPNKYWGSGNLRDQEEISRCADLRRARVKELDAIVDKIVKSVPAHMQPGTMRWARALGY